MSAHHLHRALFVAVSLALGCTAATGAESTTVLDAVEVTTNKVPETLRDVAASVTVVSGDEMRARGAYDLRTALSLVAGVEISPGGDAGPASSVPALWGLREFDAFLLLVDGVPWGGAFQPALATLDLANVERIEVLKGAAPVSYGATSFVGVIHVIHYAAGEGPTQATLGIGSRGTVTASLALPLARNPAGMSASLLLDGEKQELKPDRSDYNRFHGLYRLAGDVAEGRFTLDLDGSAVRQDPASPHPREGRTLTDRFPLDANINPSDGRIDENRVQLALGYVQNTSLGEWTTKFAAAQSDTDSTRGFLRADFADDGETHNADGFRQTKSLTEVYFDTHIATALSDRASLVWGVDYLYGDGEQKSSNFEYGVLPNGANAPDSHSLPIDERTRLTDRRNFGGAYAALHFAVTDAWRIEAGLRWNRTQEKREGQVVPSDPDEEGFEATDHRKDTRGSGTLGTSFDLWREGKDGITAYADYRNSYKPAVIDFGPEAEGDILKPETARSGEAGLKGEHMNGRFEWELSVFHMDFKNLVVAQEVNGAPGLTNAGTEKFKGVELEARYSFDDALMVHGSWSYHDARFGDYVQDFDGTPTQLSGKLLELAPQHLGSVGLLYAPAQGWNANVVVDYVGPRFLNRRNTALASNYTTVDAGIGYRFDRQWEVRVDGYNLSDRRDPVAESELGESQYYRMPARSVVASVRYVFGR